MIQLRLLLLLTATLYGIPALSGDTAIQPIRKAEQFAVWRKATSASPLDALSPGARERFLASLTFGSQGLGGFDPTDLALELDSAQIRSLLAIFGDEVADYTDHIRLADARNHAIAVSRRTGISELEYGYNRFYRRRQEASGSDYERAKLIEQAYVEEIPRLLPAAAAELDHSDLQLRLRAALEAGNETESSRIGGDALQAWNEFERRGLVSSNDIEQMFNLLLAARRFEDAISFAKLRADALPSIPELRQGGDIGSPSVWEYSADGSKLTRRKVSLQMVQIIVTAGCHFSEDAADDIGSDPLLGPAFKKHATWLSLPLGRERLAALNEWNRTRPYAPMHPIYDRAEWPIFSSWPMPRFHIVKNGQIIESVTGWPRSEPTNRAALIAMLQRHGLLPASTAP